MDAQLAAEAFPVDLLATPQGYGIDIYAAGIDAQVANGIPQVAAHPAVRRDHRVHPVHPRSRLQQLQASPAYSG